jgi:phage/plasmid-like protein (TIGR03299 family)
MTTLWHRAGVDLTGGSEQATIDFVLDRASLNWTIEKRQAYTADNNGQMQPIPGRYAPVRADTGCTLPATVGPVWEPFQNRDLVRFALQDLRAVSGLEIVPARAGLLGVHGERSFIELRIGRELTVRRGGVQGAMQPYLLLHNAHDGSGSILAHERVSVLICSNGAVTCRNGAFFSVRHTASAQQRLDEGARMLENFEVEMHEFERVARDLANTPMNRSDFVTFAAQLLTKKDDADEALELVGRSEGKSAKQFRERGQTLLGLFERGIGNRGADRFDALNSVTEFVDHQRGRIASWKSRASRLQINRALDAMTFGGGADLKRRALRLLTK